MVLCTPTEKQDMEDLRQKRLSDHSKIDFFDVGNYAYYTAENKHFNATRMMSEGAESYDYPKENFVCQKNYC